MLLGFYAASFGAECCARQPIHTLNYWTVQSVVPGFYLEVCLSVTLLIMCNEVHPLNDALPGPYMPVWVTRGSLVAHRYTYAPPRCRTSQYRITFITLTCPSGTILLNSVFDGVGLAGFESRANDFRLPWVASPALRWPGIKKVARSLLTECSKSCDLQPALQCVKRGAQGVLPWVG